MKSKTYDSSKNNGFKGQFKSLNNDEMISLKGGGANPIPPNPPLPPSGGDDYPLSAAAKVPVLTITVNHAMPAAASNAAVAFTS